MVTVRVAGIIRKQLGWYLLIYYDLFSSSLQWPNILSDISIIWAHEAKDKYKTLEIYVSVPSVAKSIISWISRNFPRRHLSEQTCRIDTHSVS